MTELSLACRHRFQSGFELQASFATSAVATALFGPSGSGKTTLLRIIAGQLPPQAGRVSLGPNVLLDTAEGICLPPEARRVGFVPQQHWLFPHLSVRGNLEFGRKRRSSARRIDLADVVEVLELGTLLDRRPAQLSGGQQQRVALGRALLSHPDFLLLDEPLASLDPALRDRILLYLERIVGQWQLPMLVVTHSQAEVRRIAQQVVLIEAGRVIGAGPTDEMLERPEPLDWIDSAGPTNLLQVRAVQQGDSWFGELGRERLVLPASAGLVAGRQWIECSPRDVALARSSVAGTSLRNQLPGVVAKVVERPTAVFVAVDVGQMLWAQITPQAARELELAVGRPITCLVKAQSLRLLAS